MQLIARVALVAFALCATGQARGGALLRHVILETDTDEASQTLRACRALRRTPTRLLCLPTASALGDPGRIQLDLSLKANETGFRVMQRATSGDVDREFLEKLFAEDSFQDVSGVARLSARNGPTSLTYTPLHIMGAFKLTNPGLPEIHLGAVRQSVLRVEHGFYFTRWFGDGWGELVLSPSLLYYDRTLLFADFDVLALSTEKASELVKPETSRSVDGDIRVAVLGKRGLVPSLALDMRNVASGVCEKCEDRYIDVERHVLARGEIVTSVSMPHPIGASALGVSLPFWSYFAAYDAAKTAVFYSFQTSRLKSFASFSPEAYSFGFLFEATNHRLGIQYTDEKQDNRLAIERRKQTYVFTSFFF